MQLTICLFLTSLVGYTAMAGAATQLSPLDSLPLSLNSDDSFKFQLLVDLGLAKYDGADVADILAAARVIQPGSFYSYNTTFYDLAVYAQNLAKSHKCSVNAQERYFAASLYWRNADFYLHGNWTDPLLTTYWKAQTECFDAAIATLPVPGERVTIPADGFDAIGIFFSLDHPSKRSFIKRPTLLIGNGYDAAQEDSYHQTGVAALKRGWNVMVYEGPGQATIRRTQGKGFIYDWEKVVSPVVDYLATRPDVDMDRLVLMGISLGGYLAARAAAFEPRIKALILIGGVFDFFKASTQSYPPELLQLFLSGNQPEFDEIIYQYIVNNQTANTSKRWAVQQGLWSFNTKSPYEYVKRTELFTLANITNKIQIPTWIANPTVDDFFPGQSVEVANALGSLATLVNFTGPASYHVTAGAFDVSNRAIFDWLDELYGSPQQTRW